MDYTYRRLSRQVRHSCRTGDIQESSKSFYLRHSHILKVMYDKKLQLLHINPGAAGKYGFHKQRTLVRFSIEEGQFKDLEVIELADEQR